MEHLLTADRRRSDLPEAVDGAAGAESAVRGSSTFQRISSHMISPYAAYSEHDQKVLPSRNLQTVVAACRGAGTKLCRDVHPPDVTERGAAGQSSSTFSTPAHQMLPPAAPPPSRNIHHSLPKKRFSASKTIFAASSKMATGADTTASSWREESLRVGSDPFAEAHATESYPETFVLRPVVERASSGADFRPLTRDTDRQDFGGGSAAYMGTADYCKEANPQEGSRSEEVASVGTSCAFSTPARQQLPFAAPPPSRKMHHSLPKKRFFTSKTDFASFKTSAVADTGTTAASWRGESLGVGSDPSVEAETTGSYPEAFVLRSVVERASSGADYHSVAKDTGRQDFGGGSAAFLGTADPQEGSRSEEVASVGTSCAFSTPARQQLPLAAPPRFRKLHHSLPKKRFSSGTRNNLKQTGSESSKHTMLENTATSDFTLWGDPTSAARSGPSATAATRSLPEAFANQPALGRASSLSDRWFLSREDTGLVGSFSTEAGNCAGSNARYAEYEGIQKVGSFSGLKHSNHCEVNEEAMMRQCAKEIERMVDTAPDIEDDATKPSGVKKVGSLPVRFEEGRRGAESAVDLPRNVVGNVVSLAAVEATYDDVIDLTIEEEEVGESPYFTDEDCDIPITGGAATEVAIAQSNIEDRSGGVDGSRINNGSGQASADSREDVSTHEPSPLPRRSRNIWEIGDRYRFVRNLGHGSYGEVAQCEDLEEGGYVAIKRILNVFESEVDTKRIYREIFILRHMKHPDIINLKNIILPTNYDNFRDLYLVFEFVDTDLYKLIGSPQFLTDDHIKLFLYQMLNGLKFVHSTHVIHRDMKPANILINEDCSLKICDFGLSRVVPEEPPNDTSSSGGGSYGAAGKRACSPVKQSSHIAGDSGKGKGRDTPANEEPPVLRRTLKRQLTKHVVTRWYRAPELILLQDYNKAVDVWSVGCIFAELLTMQEGSFSSPQERSALFPGKSCFPLSAEKPASYADGLDQLNVIFDVIGTPSAEDMKDLGDVSKYLEKLKVKPAVNLREKFKGASHQALELLGMMLRFDPQKRITVDEALEHPYLASCRTREAEVTARLPITMEFEDIDMNKAKLKRLVYEEVLRHGSSKKRSRSNEGQEAGDGSPKSRRLK